MSNERSKMSRMGRGLVCIQDKFGKCKEKPQILAVFPGQSFTDLAKASSFSFKRDATALHNALVELLVQKKKHEQAQDTCTDLTWFT